MLVENALALAERYLRDTRPTATSGYFDRLPGSPFEIRGPCAWFVLQTRLHGEDKAVEALGEQGFDSYVPTMRKEVYRRRKLVEREFRLFNRYVFARLPLNLRDWNAVFEIAEIDYVLGDHDGPCSVPDAEIERFKGAEEARAFDVTKSDRFPVGSRVRVKSGAFGDFAGQVVSLPGRGIVKAMIELLGRLVPVEFRYDMVEPD